MIQRSQEQEWGVSEARDIPVSVFQILKTTNQTQKKSERNHYFWSKTGKAQTFEAFLRATSATPWTHARARKNNNRQK